MSGVAESDFGDDDSEFAALVRRFAAAPEIPLEHGVALQAGTVVGGAYRVEAIVGRGGMGVVARARDLRLERPVALKVHARAPDQTGLDVLRAEAQAMAVLADPNVVEVFEVGTHEGQLFIAMEFVSGGTLREWQKGRRRREIVAKYIEAGRGLAAAHRAGLVHRDFKPANVLMDAGGRPRVADFGLVLDLSLPQAETLRDYGEGTATNPVSVRSGVSVHAIAGTPGYMAP
ncbi:MAG: serine/threonine-protein kinase, partial [Myxococcota bacterium]